MVWLVRPAGEVAQTALARVRPSADDLADAAAWEGAERGVARLRRRLLLRVLAAETLGVKPEDVAIAREPGGRPRIASPAPAYASVARGGEWAALAVSRRPIGVDLAVADLRSGVPPLPPEEAAALRGGAASAAEGDRRLAGAWAAREAYLKAMGAGLAAAAALRVRPEGGELRVEGPAGAARAHLRALDAWIAAAVLL